MRLRQVATVARDLESVVEDFSGVLGLEVAKATPRPGLDDSFLVELDRSTLRFRKPGDDGRVGVTGIDLRAADLGRIMREALDRRLERGRNRVRMEGVDLFFG